MLYPREELGRQLSEPRESDFRCLKHTPRHLRGTLDLVTAHKINGDPKPFKGATDSDWAGCAETRKSTRCGAVHGLGAAILSYARSESVPEQNRPEAEHVGAVALRSETLHTQRPSELLGLRDQSRHRGRRVLRHRHGVPSRCGPRPPPRP